MDTDSRNIVRGVCVNLGTIGATLRKMIAEEASLAEDLYEELTPEEQGSAKGQSLCDALFLLQEAEEHIGGAKRCLDKVTAPFVSTLCPEERVTAESRPKYNYTEEQLSVLKHSEEYPGAIKVRDGNGNATKWIGINKDSIPTIINFLEKEKEKINEKNS